MREEEEVLIGEEKIGKTTSGTHCPAVGAACAMAYVAAAHSAVGTAVEVMVRGRRVTAEIVPLPFYKKSR